jgi:hypothetical protein
MQSDDPATHDINDNPATHDINGDEPNRRGFASDDTTTGAAAPGSPQAYTCPVSDLEHEYIGITSGHLNVGVSTDNWSIPSGSGDDAIAVHGGTGSNFLTGRTGLDTLSHGSG